MIALDTNLLVYSHSAEVPEHRGAQRAIAQALQAAPCGVALPVVGEFWCVVTHPSSTGHPSTPRQALEFLENLWVAGVLLWYPGAGFETRLLALASELKTAGPRIFDLQIGLMAMENGAREIWTNDRHFTRIPGLKVKHPLA